MEKRIEEEKKDSVRREGERDRGREREGWKEGRWERERAKSWVDLTGSH
jgi:hypothetical protein